MNEEVMNEVTEDVIENVPEVVEETARKGIPSGLKKAGLIVGGATATVVLWEKAVKPLGKKLIGKLKVRKAAKHSKDEIDPRDVRVIDESQYKVD